MKTAIYFFVLLFTGIARADQQNPEAKPVDQLPVQVPSAEGKASLHIDWPKDRQKPFDVYLINRTTKPIELVIAYGQIRLYWEAEMKPQQWERAEVQYWDQCGTGIGTYQLQPGQWIKQQEQYSDQAISKTAIEYPIRLRSYNPGFDVSSNAAKGYVEPQTIAVAHCDSLAIHIANLDRLVEIVRGCDPICKVSDKRLAGMIEPRHSALWESRNPRHDRQQVLIVLALLSSESAELRELIAPTLKELKKE